MTQHASLTTERWMQFSLDQQILMIANEMHRASQLMKPVDRDRLRNSYERVLRLVDLTVRVNSQRALRRELLRWRDVVAQLYVDTDPDPTAHAQILRCLLTFTPVAARQRSFLLAS